MKAEYISFNGDWHKNCSRCEQHYGANSLSDLSAFFPKDKRKHDGFADACKKCKSNERKIKKDQELSRWKKYYSSGSEARKRHIVRSQTRRKYGSAKNKNCKFCNNKAQEWHHIKYETDSVIALCSNCHEKI